MTTRQAVQLHDLDIDSVCDIMEDGIEHHLFTRGGGGNFPRNVSLSPLAGVEKAEAFVCNITAVTVESAMERKSPTYKSCLASLCLERATFLATHRERATSIPAVVSEKQSA